MDLKWKIGIIEYDFDKIIDELIIEESRKEAKEIISKSIDATKHFRMKMSSHFQKRMSELCAYVERDMGNIICLQISAMKKDLSLMLDVEVTGDAFDENF